MHSWRTIYAEILNNSNALIMRPWKVPADEILILSTCKILHCEEDIQRTVFGITLLKKKIVGYDDIVLIVDMHQLCLYSKPRTISELPSMEMC